MIVVVQRVTKSNVISNGVQTGNINNGLALLIGIENSDTLDDIYITSKKIANLRIFSDENDKMNLSVIDIKGSVIVVPNFTLCANYKHGNRPDYLNAKNPKEASEMFDIFVEEMRKYVEDVQTGIFGADMHYTIENDGPITIVIDSKVLKK